MLEMLNDRQKMGVAHQMVESIAIVKKSGLFDIDMPPVMEWKALNLPCPFLVDGQCSVYERRPISCRAHMAVGPPEWCMTRRPEQKYVEAKEVSKACGQAIIVAHLKLGNTILHDNLLALLEKELLGEYHETASAQQIVFTETDKKERTENGK